MTTNMEKMLQERRETYIQWLCDVVGKDTRVVGHGIDGGYEENGQAWMEEMLRTLGADRIVSDPMSEAVIQKSIQCYHEGNPGHNYENRRNIYATFRGSDPMAKSLMFNGHMDTMPYGDITKWKYPPIQGTVADGWIYGLGTTDMKAGLVAALAAVDLVRSAGHDLKGDVVITSVCDEEGGGNGSIQAAMRGEKADGVIVAEPSDQALFTCHNGFIFFQVDVVGKAVHSGSKWEGVSAIEKAWKLIRALDALEQHWQQTKHHDYLPSPSGNVGVIEGGTAGSTTADFCRFKTCIHYNPGMTHDGVVDEVMAAIDGVCAEDSWLAEHPPQVSIYQAGGPFEQALDDPFVHSFENAFQQAMGKPVTHKGLPGGCDSRTWKNTAGCPTLHYGPGDPVRSHSIDEALTEADFISCILVYANLILDWCN